MSKKLYKEKNVKTTKRAQRPKQSTSKRQAQQRKRAPRPKEISRFDLKPGVQFWFPGQYVTWISKYVGRNREGAYIRSARMEVVAVVEQHEAYSEVVVRVHKDDLYRLGIAIVGRLHDGVPLTLPNDSYILRKW